MIAWQMAIIWILALTGIDDIAFSMIYVIRLSSDQEPMVRAELMEQIPHIAMFCHMNSSLMPRWVTESCSTSDISQRLFAWLWYMAKKTQCQSTISFKMLQRPLFYVNRAVPERILPILVNYLRDNNNQVRKTSQAALLVLLEQGMWFVMSVTIRAFLRWQCFRIGGCIMARDMSNFRCFSLGELEWFWTGVTQLLELR